MNKVSRQDMVEDTTPMPSQSTPPSQYIDVSPSPEALLNPVI